MYDRATYIFSELSAEILPPQFYNLCYDMVFLLSLMADVSHVLYLLKIDISVYQRL